MAIKLIILWKDDEEKPRRMQRTYNSNAVSIGRHIMNDFCIPERLVSRHHTRIEYNKGKYWLCDLGSVNGTYLNGKKLQKNAEVEIKHGSKIGICQFDIEVVLAEKHRKKTLKPEKFDSSLCDTAYKTLEKIMQALVPNAMPYNSADEIEHFGKQIAEVVKIFFDEFTSSLKAYLELIAQLDIQTEQYGWQENPLKFIFESSEPDAAGFILSKNSEYDEDERIRFLKEACDDLTRHKIAVLKIMESSLCALLENVSPEQIYAEVKNSGAQKLFISKALWELYVKKHKELAENQSKRYEIIIDEFQKLYADIMKKGLR